MKIYDHFVRLLHNIKGYNENIGRKNFLFIRIYRGQGILHSLSNNFKIYIQNF